MATYTERLEEWRARLRLNYYPWGTPRSLVIETAYGRIVVFCTGGRLDWRLMLGGRFVRPTPEELYICCHKRATETRSWKGRKSYLRNIELQCCCWFLRNHHECDLEGLYRWLLDWYWECRICTACENCERPDIPNWLNLAENAEWEVIAVSIHPVPPDTQRECYLRFEREYEEIWSRRHNVYIARPGPCWETVI